MRRIIFHSGREIRELVDSYPGNPVLIGEANEPNIQNLVEMYGPNDDDGHGVLIATVN